MADPRRPATEAGDGARTRDPQLGKLMLYQLSYTRAGPIYQGAQGRGKQAAPYTCSRKLRRSASHTAGSPPTTLLSFPSRIHRSSSSTSEKRWSKESTMKSSGW